MKKATLTLFVLTALISCNQHDATFDLINCENESLTAQSYTEKISEEDALKIATSLLKKNDSTRFISNDSYDCEYIVAQKETRHSSEAPDTLAYIFNKSNKSGFAVISADSRTYPILAYSEDGYFNQNNPSIQENFITPLNTYVNSFDMISPSNPDIFDRITTKGPFIQKSIGQWDPYNKYIDLSHPGFPVGCVTIATAQIILHSSDTLPDFHGRTVQLESIRNALKYHKDNQESQQPTYSNNNGPIYSYNEALDSLGVFLSLLSDDLQTIYLPDEDHYISSALNSNAYKYLSDKGFCMKSQYSFFNLENIADYISQNCIIYISGKDPKQRFGHAFLADGYIKTYDANNELKSISLHIDWGWEGESNGYFLGDVFEAKWGNYSPEYYFAVRCLDYDYLASIWINGK